MYYTMQRACLHIASLVGFSFLPADSGCCYLEEHSGALIPADMLTVSWVGRELLPGNNHGRSSKWAFTLQSGMVTPVVNGDLRQVVRLKARFQAFHSANLSDEKLTKRWFCSS